MTAKMQSCVDHIKTSVDVDPWAAEMVEKIFAEYDRRFDKVLEIILRMGISNAYDRPSFWFNKRNLGRNRSQTVIRRQKGKNALDVFYERR